MSIILVTGASGFVGSYALPELIDAGHSIVALVRDERAREKAIVSLRYVNNAGAPTETYPANPNGSPDGITGLTTADGRFTIVMPHPERVFRTVQLSWHPAQWGEDSPWMRMFRNARKWVG